MATTLSSLWLPIILSGVALFFASWAAWMLLPHHKGEWKGLPDEEGVMAALRKFNIPPGQYNFPHACSHEEMNTDDYKRRKDAGPSGFLTVWQTWPNMGVNMACTVLFFTVANFVIGYLAGSVIPPGTSFMSVFRFVGTAGILTYGTANILNGIWFNRKMAADIIDGVAYGLITGLIFAAPLAGPRRVTTSAIDIEQVASWLASSHSAVVLTGAGISTESGIPDFRSPGGVWSKYRTVYFDEFLAAAEARHEYWRQKSEMHREFANAQPNVGHQVLARWEAAGRIRGVITQNIDGLHQMAGSQDVLELHGTARQAACLDCRARYEIGPLVEQFVAQNCVPACPSCGGRLKHATISFGQMLPADVMLEANRWSREVDLMLAIGSSLVVTPAADLPHGKAQGARLVIINRDPTPLDPLADAILSTSIGEVLAAIDQAICVTP